MERFTNNRARRLIVDGERVCVEMPALVLLPGSDVFEPLWRLRGVEVTSISGVEYACFKPRSRVVVRSGRGWGRRGGDSYYIVEPGGGHRRLAKRPVKTLEGVWLVALVDRATGEVIYTRVTDRGIVVAGREVVF